MPEVINQPPIPGILLESLRNAGYTLETAVADIIDNSITAEATHISVQDRGYFDAGKPWIAICDDGYGMTEQTLLDAMRFGSRSVSQSRTNERDLGRFGLGMKMASISQARKVTVISNRDGKRCACCWDLDVISNQWELQQLTDAELDELQIYEEIVNSLKFSVQPHGTVVLWEKLDRSSVQDEKSFKDAMAEVKEHIALVFHRFMVDEAGCPKAIKFDRNGMEIHPRSPFGPVFRHILYGGELLGGKIKYQPYLLPRESEYEAHPDCRDDSGRNYEAFAGKDGYQRNQGFYIYRNRRLIEKATFFHRRKKTIKTQLLRIKLDIPAELDAEWNIDVRKSQVTPPRDIVDELDRIMEKAISDAMALWLDQPRLGGRTSGGPFEVVWKSKSGCGCYEINLEHALYKLIRNSLDKGVRKIFKEYLQTIADTFPYEQYYRDRSSQKLARRGIELNRLYEFIENMVAFGVKEETIRIMLEQNQMSFDQEEINKALALKFQPSAH